MKDPRTIWIDAAGVGACAALSLGAFFVGVRPIFLAQQAHKSEVQTLIQTQSKADAAAQDAFRAEQRQQEIVRKRDEASFVLHGPGDRLQRLKALSDLASGSGLQINSLDPGEPESSGQYMAYPMRLTGKGTFTSVATFFDGLHAEFQDVRAVRCRLSRSVNEKSGEEQTMPQATSEFELGLVWFAARDGSIVGVPGDAP